MRASCTFERTETLELRLEARVAGFGVALDIAAVSSLVKRPLRTVAIGGLVPEFARRLKKHGC